MYLLDDYYDGKIYLGQDKADLENVLPEHLKGFVDALKEFPTEETGWGYVGESGLVVDFYFGKITEDRVLDYLRDRDCLNALIGV